MLNQCPTIMLHMALSEHTSKSNGQPKCHCHIASKIEVSDMSWGYPQSSSIFVMAFSINHPAFLGYPHDMSETPNDSVASNQQRLRSPASAKQQPGPAGHQGIPKRVSRPWLFADLKNVTCYFQHMFWSDELCCLYGFCEVTKMKWWPRISMDFKNTIKVKRFEIRISDLI